MRVRGARGAAGALALRGMITWAAHVSAGDPITRSVESPVAVGRAVFEGAAPGTHDRALLFNATSCEECHTRAAGSAAPKRDGPLPLGLVIQLGSLSSPSGAERDGDPVYGHVLNTASAEGVKPEGVPMVRYGEIEGHYYPQGIKVAHTCAALRTHLSQPRSPGGDDRHQASARYVSLRSQPPEVTSPHTAERS
jgi:hypothetical protein